MNLNTVSAWPHERRLGLVPHVLEMDHRVALTAKVVQDFAGARGRALRPHEWKGSAREVVALDVDNQQGRQNRSSPSAFVRPPAVDDGPGDQPKLWSRPAGPGRNGNNAAAVGRRAAD